MEPQPQKQKAMEEEKLAGEKKVWILANFVKLMQGVSSIDDLREKLIGNGNYNTSSSDTTEEVGSLLTVKDSNNTSTSEAYDGQMGAYATGKTREESEDRQVVDNEKGWSPVPPGKTARRGCHKTPCISIVQGGTYTFGENDSNMEKDVTAAGIKLKRDESPHTPSPQ